MTDSNTPAPTDAEIDALLRPFYESDEAAEMAKHDDRLTARAVLAKWGTPAPASQPAAQAQEEAVAQAVAAEREACAQLAAQTVCDMHIPTGVKIYGTRAAKAIRARGTDAAKPAAQVQKDAGGWMRDGGMLYRLTDERRPTNFDEIRVTMANGSRDTGQLSAQAERLLVMLVAPQPPAQAQPVATIYVTEDGSREVDDWKVELPVGATTLYTIADQPTAQAGWCDGCSPDNCGGCMTSAAPAQAAPVDAPHSTAALCADYDADRAARGAIS